MKKIFYSFDFLSFFLLIFLPNIVHAQNNNFPIDTIPNSEINSRIDSLKLEEDSIKFNEPVEIEQLLQSLAPPPKSFIEKRDSSNIKYIPFFTESEDYEKALQKAKKSGKPILIYFSGYGCINARKMEDFILNDPSIQKFCLKNIEVITLYVDRSKKLKEPIEVNFGDHKKKIRTIGQKNSYFQIQAFEYGSQPQLVFIDNKEKELISIGYTSDINEVKQFLKKGKDLFEEL